MPACRPDRVRRRDDGDDGPYLPAVLLPQVAGRQELAHHRRD